MSGMCPPARRKHENRPVRVYSGACEMCLRAACDERHARPRTMKRRDTDSLDAHGQDLRICRRDSLPHWMKSGACWAVLPLARPPIMEPRWVEHSPASAARASLSPGEGGGCASLVAGQDPCGGLVRKNEVFIYSVPWPPLHTSDIGQRTTQPRGLGNAETLEDGFWEGEGNIDLSWLGAKPMVPRFRATTACSSRGI